MNGAAESCDEKAIVSPKELQSFLRSEWRRRGHAGFSRHHMGLSISEIVRYANKRNASCATPYVDLWVAILDEVISWNISLFSVVYDQQVTLSNFEKAVVMHLAKVIADSMAIRTLILTGFDAQAKILVRSAGEYLESLVVILDDPALANEFVLTDDVEAAGKYWKQYLARGGARKRIYAAWAAFFGEDGTGSAKWFAEWGNTWIKRLSTITHPSFCGGILSTIPAKTKYTDESWLGFLGDRSDGSVETIYCYLAYVFPVLLLRRDYPFSGMSSEIGRHIEYDPTNEMHAHVKIGRDILSSLILEIARPQTGMEFFPEYDESIFVKNKV